MGGSYIDIGREAKPVCGKYATNTPGEFLLALMDGNWLKMVKLRFALSASNGVTVAVTDAKYTRESSCSQVAVTSAWDTATVTYVSTSLSARGYGVQGLVIRSA